MSNDSSEKNVMTVVQNGGILFFPDKTILANLSEITVYLNVVDAENW